MGVFCGFLVWFVTWLAWFLVMNFTDDSIVLQCQRIRQACRSESLIPQDPLSSQCPFLRQFLPHLLRWPLCSLLNCEVSCASSGIQSHWYLQLTSHACGLPLCSQQQVSVCLCDGRISCLCAQAGMSPLPARNTNESVLMGKIGCLEGFKSRGLLF